MRFISTGALALALSLGLALSAQASSVTWTLQGFVFDDGGTAQGSFDYDATANLFTNINVTTSGGGIQGASFTAPTAFGSGGAFDFVEAPQADLTGLRNLYVLLSGQMTALGGTIQVSLFTSGISSTESVCTTSDCNSIDVQRRLTAGSITTAPTALPIPLPGALPLLAGGLAVLGVAGWRRRRAG